MTLHRKQPRSVLERGCFHMMHICPMVWEWRGSMCVGRMLSDHVCARARRCLHQHLEYPGVEVTRHASQQPFGVDGGEFDIGRDR